MIIRKEDLESYLSQGFSEVASSKSHAFVEKDNYFKKWARDTRATIDSTFGADSRPSMVFLNGNPFTKGHLYLIDIARRRSSFVVVFVNNGQLDFGGHGNHEKSHIEFSFEDRFALIKEELRVYSNVLVLPSGPYFLSRLSFPDNVLDNKARVALSCSVLDSALFLDAIVPSLRLSCRFIGDEPRDELEEIHLNILRQECASKAFLLKVVERKRFEERYITSSTVRELLEERNFEEVKNLVPEAVYEFLRKQFV